jgi:YD repeat-containing protein
VAVLPLSANGLSTTWQYDSLGRKTLESRADGTTTKVHYQWVENEPQDILYENGSPNILYQVTTTTSGSSPKTTYFDAFNRTIREQHTGFDVVLLPSTIPLPVVVLLVLLPKRSYS